MKKLIITCALLTSASMLSFAQSTQTSATMSAQPNGAAPQAMQNNQQQRSPEQIAERRAQIYQKQFGLDDNQYKGVYAAELEYIKQLMDLRAKGQQPAPGQAQQMNADKDAKFKAVMSADQYQKYSATRRPMPQQQAPNPAAPANK